MKKLLVTAVLTIGFIGVFQYVAAFPIIPVPTCSTQLAAKFKKVSQFVDTHEEYVCKWQTTCRYPDGSVSVYESYSACD